MKRILGYLSMVHDGLTFFAAVLASIGLISIVTCYVYEVITRYFFNAPTAWVSDFVSYALAASIFLALPKVTKDKGHVAVTILVDVVPETIANYVHTIISLIGFGCLGLAAYISLQENIRQFTKNIETLAIIPIPQWWVSSFITFGLALSALYMLRHAKPTHRHEDSTFSEITG
ncbi:MAG TPA: TRAP transporter small permease [Gammaproteobacteria bacterium]|nr:hypothetical protein [Gammaproteobacteria bacterium]HIF81417.1 TRAP transporter small permease [Gammaproteobacteria bacterium]HIM05800.1 TRAP transporter small permease [Gammaproteobacteria bacterium]